MNLKYIKWVKKLGMFLFLASIGCICNVANAETETREVKKPIRAMLLIPKNISLDHAKSIVSDASNAGFNTILFRISNNLPLETIQWDTGHNLWDESELKDFIQHVEQEDLNLVPELKLLSHQEKLLGDSFPSIMYNSVTYDPLNEEVYLVILPYLDEIIKLFDPPAIHIGHDEIAGHNRRSRKRWLEDSEKTLPADQFLAHVQRINEYLNQNQVLTWMWGDMLISPDEFPNMLSRHLHGDFKGYGKMLRDQIPRNILITDWHNFDPGKDFSSIDTFKRDGFQVVGSSWDQQVTIVNFTDYAAKHQSDGMLFTPWGYFPEKRSYELKGLINSSGSLFKRYFPDK